MTKDHPHWGTTLDSFLEAEGIMEDVRTEATARVVAWQLGQEMEHEQGEAGRTDAHQPRAG